MSRSGKAKATFGILLLMAMAGSADPSNAQEYPGQSWREIKCTRYRAAWSEAVARHGMRGLSKDFLSRHEAFLASGCTARADVCPRSAEELDLANMMVVAAMNAGTASTFPPFACRK